MMILKNIPAEVYLVALDLMGEPRPADPADACAVHDNAISRVGYSRITAHQGGSEISPLSAFGLALAQYVSLSGPFDETDGEFAGIGGFAG